MKSIASQDIIGKGGKRPGAGRPKLPPNRKKVAWLASLSPEVREWLQQQKNASRIIENLIREKMKIGIVLLIVYSYLFVGWIEWIPI